MLVKWCVELCPQVLVAAISKVPGTSAGSLVYGARFGALLDKAVF